MTRTAVLSRRRISTPSFLAATTSPAFNRPLAKAGAARLVPFTDKAGLDAAIAGMAAGDYIYYNGSGVLTINTTTSVNAYLLSGLNPASMTVIDFGTAQSVWGTPTTGNYVKFTQNHTSANGFSALGLQASSNLAVYGGEYTSTSIGIALHGALTNVWLLDAWVHDVAMHGILAIPSTSSGAVATIQTTTIRAEVGPNWCMNPALDPHTDKGSGIHCCILFDSGNNSSFKNNTIAIYGHDSLTQGATSYGQTWPEGGGGSCIEIGQDGSGDGSGNTLYAKAEHFHMKPTGTNPGSTAQQFGGNCLEFWGGIPLTGLVVGWVEGNDLTGGVVNSDSAAGWHSVAITVTHGRHSNVNQSTAGSNPTVPYKVITNVTYNDCT